MTVRQVFGNAWHGVLKLRATARNGFCSSAPLIVSDPTRSIKCRLALQDLIDIYRTWMILSVDAILIELLFKLRVIAVACRIARIVTIAICHSDTASFSQSPQ